jgi:salicylate hydroxylase
MTPMAGIGANTALRDADLLRRRLLTDDLLPAVHSYEEQMRVYGFAAVAKSLRNARMGASANRPARLAFRTTLRTLSAIPPLKRKFAAGLGA